MPAVRHIAGSPFRFFQGLNPDTSKPWPVGEVRDVSKDVADYLISEYPTAFEPASIVQASAPAEPDVDRAVKSPPKRKAPTKRKAPAKPKTKAKAKADK